MDTKPVPVRRKMGVKTRNPFFNFLREFRAQTKVRKMSVVTQKASVKWRKMTEVQKMHYIMMARNQPLRSKRKPQLRLNARKELREADWSNVTYVN